MNFTTREVLWQSSSNSLGKGTCLIFLSISSTSTNPGTQWHARNAAKQHFENTGYQTVNTWKVNNIWMFISWGDMQRCPVNRIYALLWRTKRNMCIGFDLLCVRLAISYNSLKFSLMKICLKCQAWQMLGMMTTARYATNILPTWDASTLSPKEERLGKKKKK